MSATIDTGHICLGESGVPVVDGTTIKVVEVVLDYLAYGWSPEEIHFQHPTLSMGQIHSALGYYWDHKEELDVDIARRLAITDLLHGATPPNPHIERLRAGRS